MITGSRQRAERSGQASSSRFARQWVPFRGDRCKKSGVPFSEQEGYQVPDRSNIGRARRVTPRACWLAGGGFNT
jgi:hypothetical protein